MPIPKWVQVLAVVVIAALVLIALAWLANRM